jgi:GntR family transcriptional regulator
VGEQCKHLNMSLKLEGEFEPGKPLYVRAASAIRAYVEERGLQPGAPLPSEHQLCELIGVSRVTLRRAVDELVKAHLLVRRQGVGTFVARERLVQPLTDLQSTRDLTTRGEGAFSSSIRSHEQGRATPTEAEMLGLRTKAAVMRFTRVDANAGEAFGVARFVIPRAYGKGFTSEALDEHSSYELLADLEVFPDRAVQQVRVEQAEPDVADILGLRPEEPVLVPRQATLGR